MDLEIEVQWEIWRLFIFIDCCYGSKLCISCLDYWRWNRCCCLW